MNQDLLNLAKEMVAIRSVSNDGNTEISDYIEAWLKATGFDEIERLGLATYHFLTNRHKTDRDRFRKPKTTS